ncbi:tyrosine-type recombinase/integrase [Saccharicrinis aurantiacus]|uniref:tyrosine-type recombinase/integrase n=1 Tax=Saccharicrinis aurantiacus TaxID=1849719 RepID=UPI002491C2FB|nr:site-specific integrase [Saccharicrinis aurantiacus]
MGAKVTTAIVLYKAQTKKNGKHPAKLRVTYNRKQMYYSIDNKERVYEFTLDEFNKVIAPKPRGVFKDIKLEFSLIEDKAKKIITSMDSFSFRQFKTRFGIAGGDLTNILYYFERRITEYGDNDQWCSWAQFTTAMRTLKRYFGSNQVDFRELSAHELEKYEQWMTSQGLSMSSIGSYMAATRTIFKIAQREGAISKDFYPFGEGGYKLPSGQNIKRALKMSEIEKIYKYECEAFSPREEAKDLWLFSYLLNGANMNDIIRLKYKNINDEFITFIRRKTRRKSKSTKPISVALTDDLKRLIDKWGNKDRSSENYIFRFLNEEMTEKQIRRCLDRLIKRTNDQMKKIAKEVGIEKTVTTYTARHSFSTVLKRSGVSTEFIGESLGHNNLRTTELYLDSFEDETKKEVAKHLTAF